MVRIERADDGSSIFVKGFMRLLFGEGRPETSIVESKKITPAQGMEKSGGSEVQVGDLTDPTKETGELYEWVESTGKGKRV